ncbi:MAG TPA: GDSL-type esterase/lipase family protein [Thermoguttaceae bacterium]|nr:GDSL-type esterase/lipase family protein [Thermoguttaceae bacterium]
MRGKTTSISRWGRTPLGRWNAVLLGVILSAATCFADGGVGPLRLTLAPELYAVPGVETSIYYDNVVLTETPEDYRFEVTCDVGEAGKRRWAVTPQAADVDDHPLEVTVRDAAGTELGRAATTLKVVPADAGAGRTIRLLIVGDSLTHATTYSNEIARLLSLPDNPGWKMLGTHKPSQAAAGVAHEGYGGWTWQRFAAHYEPDPDGTYRKRSSPFVYLGDDGKPVLDLGRYFDEACGGERPDFVTFLLGINDCFGADPEDPAAIDARIDAMFAQADVLLAAFREAAPDAELGICLTTPPNSREEGFEANYKGRYHRWGWKRIEHRLVERQIERFAGREKERLFLVPTELNLDPTDGYPTNNGVHPNEFGYRQIGASIYAWLKARLQARAPE